MSPSWFVCCPFAYRRNDSWLLFLFVSIRARQALAYHILMLVIILPAKLYPINTSVINFDPTYVEKKESDMIVKHVQSNLRRLSLFGSTKPSRVMPTMTPGTVLFIRSSNSC